MVKKKRRERNTVKKAISAMFWNNKGKIISLEAMSNIFTDPRSRRYLWDSLNTIDYFGRYYGLRGSIVQIIHELRTEGRFIFSPEGENGYVEFDTNDERSADFWDKTYLANENVREQIPETERKNLDKSLRDFIRKAKGAVRKKCVEVAEKHGVKV